MRRWILRVLFTIALSSNVHAIDVLTVLHDTGGTVPLAPLLEASGFYDESDPLPVESPLPNINQALDDMKTIRSPGLTPGRQARIAVGDAGKMLPRPIFLVGADPVSVDWLQRYRDRLEGLRAVGLIVQADGEADIRRLQQLAGPLTMAVGSGEMMAKHFGLKHYPVLIGPEWIEQ